MTFVEVRWFLTGTIEVMDKNFEASKQCSFWREPLKIWDTLGPNIREL